MGRKGWANPNLEFPTAQEIRDGTAEYPSIAGLPVYARKYKEKGKVYIIDDVNVTVSPIYSTVALPIVEDVDEGYGDDEVDNAASIDADEAAAVDEEPEKDFHPAMAEFDASPHRGKCGIVRRFFGSDTVYAVQKMPLLANEEMWNKYWDDEMDKWRTDELIIIYYEGWASGNGATYRWQITNFDSPFTVDAYGFLNKLAKTETDILMLLECYLPTRFKDKANLSRIIRKKNHSVEIVCSGQPANLGNGTYKYNNFTEKVLMSMHSVAHDGSDVKLGIHCPKAAFSIPNLMSAEPDFDNNPNRLWLTKTQKGSKAKKGYQTWRLRLDPLYPGDHNNKLAFHIDCIEDSAKVKELEEAKEVANMQNNAVFMQPLMKSLAKLKH